MCVVINMIPTQLESWRFILISPKTKIPIAEMKGWAANRETKTYKHTDQTLTEYIQAGGNYAVITDTDRFVLAADTKEVEQAIENRLPCTFSVQSPRHKTKHFYFYGKITKYIEFKPTAQGDPCCDLKYGNAYVLGAGSTYDSYGKYKVIDDLPIATVTEEQVLAAVNEFIKSKSDRPELPEENNNGTKLNPALNFPIKNILPNIEALSENGDTLTGPHPKHGSTTGSNFRVDTKKNTWYCFREGHKSGGGPLELLAVLNGIIECKDCHKGVLRGAKFQLTISKAQELGLIGPLTVTPQINEPAEDNEKLNIPALLYLLNSQFTFKTPTDLEDIYYYDNGVYVFAEHKIKSLLESWLGAQATTHIINELLDHIRRSSYIERSEFNKFKGLIPVQNGLLDLTTQTLKPFNKEEIFTYKLNTSYNPESKCPKWIKFLSEILNPEDIPLLQEYLGYCLYPAMPYHVLMWLYGKGRNGKGRIMATLEAILGTKNCAHMNIEEFNGNQRFSVAELYGKMINISSEPSTTKSLQTPLLKKLTGEDVLDAEVKNKQRRLSFLNMAKFFVLGNRFPKIDDITIAFWDRVLLIPFPKSFLGKERRANIEREWLDDAEEVSGILNWMIEGLLRLSLNREFTKTSSTEETKLEFKRASDTVMSFIDEQCTYDRIQVYTREELYELYKEYCEAYGLIIEDEKLFNSKIKQTPKIKSRFKRIEGKNARVWLGLKVLPLKQDEEIIQSTLTPEAEKAVKTLQNFVNKVVDSNSLDSDTHDTHDTHISHSKKTDNNNIDSNEYEKAVSPVSSVSPDLKKQQNDSVKPESPVTDPAFIPRECGECARFKQGDCEYPTGPDSVKADFGWANACQGWKPKEKD